MPRFCLQAIENSMGFENEQMGMGQKLFIELTGKNKRKN